MDLNVRCTVKKWKQTKTKIKTNYYYNPGFTFPIANDFFRVFSTFFETFDHPNLCDISHIIVQTFFLNLSFHFSSFEICPVFWLLMIMSVLKTANQNNYRIILSQLSISNWSPSAILVIFCVLWRGDFSEKLLDSLLFDHFKKMSILIWNWSNFQKNVKFALKLFVIHVREKMNKKLKNCVYVVAVSV